MEYQDFTIDLRSAGDGRFEATVATAPIGETPRDFFPEPIEREELRNLHHAFDVPGEEIQQKAPTETRFREVGELLYSALFHGEIGDLFRRCRAAIPRDGHSGLRLRLRFRMEDEGAEYLAALPWEWLWDRRTSDFLAADLCTPVVRDVAAAHPRSDLHVASPLRILVVDGAPNTLKQLKLKLEVERMSEALGLLEKAGQVQLLRLEKNTPEELREVLRNQEIHILHFMGHGGYDPDSGAGAIFFIADDGSEDQVDGDMLATLLKRIPSLRLVVLNSCKTARHASRLGAPLNEGVASAVLARAGIPAVVANQYSISDPGAIAFSETFDGRIAAGDGVDEALTEARLRLKGRTPEWATPALFLTAPDGKLFAMAPVRRDRTVCVAHSQSEADPVCLGVRSFVGWGGNMETRNDAVLDLTEYFDLQNFDGRYIKEKAWWQEKVFPDLRRFLREKIDERRPLLLDFAAHSSIAFAAGWLLEPKSGLDVRVRQRTGSEGEFEWSPKDGRDAEGPLWLDRLDLEVAPDAADVALALSVSQPDVAEHVREFIHHQEGVQIGRIIDAVIAPEPGPRSVQGGAHALRLAHSLLPRLRRKLPHERGGRVHFFCACPNALSFYLGQLASSLEGVVLYEFPFRAPGAFGQYQKSIELPPPGEVKGIPQGW